jgi:acetyl esterase/lipase
MKIISIVFCACFILMFMTVQAQVKKTIPLDTSFTVFQTYQKIKADYLHVTPVLPQLPNRVRADYDLVYASLSNTPFGKRDLHLDLFRPEKEGEYPAVLFVFGGGWHSGNKSMQVPLAMQISADGYVTAAVEYRLSPEALYPAAIYDIKAAIRFLRANAHLFHINPNRIAISGSSAGGHLAAFVGMTNKLKKFDGNEGNNIEASSTVQAIIAMDGVFDYTDPEERGADNDAVKPSSAGRWLGVSYQDNPLKWVEASPRFYAGKETPPILFINSSRPRSHRSRNSIIRVLNQYGIYSEVHLIPNTPHPFWLFHPWFEETVKYVDNFLDKVMK